MSQVHGEFLGSVPRFKVGLGVNLGVNLGRGRDSGRSAALEEE